MKDENFKENFKGHEIIILEDGQYTKHFVFKKGGTGTFSFDLVTAHNLIAMTGDCYSLMITPGYGRCGLAFLRGSINSEGYFLSKCPFKEQLTEYSHQEAMHHIRVCVENEQITEEDLQDADWVDEDPFWGEFRYYEFCYEKDIDEPASPKVLTETTKLQLAGLQCFVEKYNEKFR